MLQNRKSDFKDKILKNVIHVVKIYEVKTFIYIRFSFIFKKKNNKPKFQLEKHQGSREVESREILPNISEPANRKL